jgi:serine/threonine-protein kinase
VTRAPSRIDKYDVIRRLGSGGMGTVYLARDASLGREVAIKVLRGPVFDPDDEVLARFLREARATANLRHPNIVTVYDVGQHDHMPFIVMEFVDGDSLARIIQERRPLPLATKLQYLEQVCAGLHAAHRAGIVHRDIKPANLMVDAQGIIRILDFGIARLEGSGMTRDGDLMGTVNYMSPEQMLGRRVDHRSDIFALGTVAYELISYRQAFPGTLDDGLLHRVPHDPPQPLSALCAFIDPALEAVIYHAIEKAPEERYPDMAHLEDAFAACRRRTLAERGPAFEVLPAAPMAGLAPTLHRPRSQAEDEAIRSEIEEAARLLTAGDPTSAVHIAERVIAKVPTSVEAHAVLLRAQGMLALATAPDAADILIPPSPLSSMDVERVPKWVVPASGIALVALVVAVAAMLGRFGGEAPRTDRRPASPEVARPAPPPAPAPEIRQKAEVPPPVVTRAERAEPSGAAAIEPQLARGQALLREGDPAAAVDLLEPLFAETRDRRIRALLESAARDVRARVDRARAAAMTANARELASSQLAVALEAAQLTDRARRRDDYAEATRLGLTAARHFEAAALEATREADRRRTAAASEASGAAGTVPIRPDPVPEASAPGSTPTEPEAEPAPVTPPPAAPPPVVSVVDRERPAILAALEQYRNAYQRRSVAAMLDVYPSLPRERRQAYEKQFKDERNCRALDVQFGQPEIFLGGNGQANVTVMSTYVCTPVTGQAPPQQPQADVFQLRKSGDRWLITGMGAIQQ